MLRSKIYSLKKGKTIDDIKKYKKNYLSDDGDLIEIID